VADPILVTDAERDVALELLRAASVDGRLTLEDLAERAELVHVARTRDDLASATAGLELVPVPVSEEVEEQRAVLSSVVRKGRWRLARRSRFTAILGSVDLDLREAIIPGADAEIELRAVLGSVEILVPEGVEVRPSGGGILSSQDVKVPPTTLAGAPVLRLKISGALSSVSVRSRPRLVEQIKERIQDRL
jgi:DUF1707 SHOCT-like domain/Cell wall-active antibiotics response LiaF, C-terminal